MKFGACAVSKSKLRVEQVCFLDLFKHLGEKQFTLFMSDLLLLIIIIIIIIIHHIYKALFKVKRGFSCCLLFIVCFTILYGITDLSPSI